jgi:hypothetical protein
MDTPPVSTPTPTAVPAAPQPAAAPEITNTRANHFAFVLAHYKKPFIISIVVGVVLCGLSLLSTMPSTIFSVFIFVIISILVGWNAVAANKLEQELFRSYAAEHGYTFVIKPQQFSLNLPLERIGHSHRTFNLITGTTFPGVTQLLLFTHMFTVGSGKDSRTYTYCVTSLTLPESGPHLFLNTRTAMSVGSFTNYSVTGTFQSAKRYSLEGDFDKYYQLYGESSDPVDLLEIINPAVMEKIMQLRGYDIELNGNILTFYRPGQPSSITEIDNILAIGTMLINAIAPTMKRMDEAVAIQTQPQTPGPTSV